jgi:hypothetical protein
MRRAAVQHPSRFVTQAESIFSFIDEVRRAGEMTVAAQSGGGFPRGNWVHVFDGFDGVVDALQSELRVRGSLRRARLVANLRQEILANAQNLLGKSAKGTNHPYCEYVSDIRPRFTGHPFGKTTIPERTLERIAAFAFVAGHVGERLSTRILDEAIGSGEFLEWSTEMSAFRVGDLQGALLRLREEIDLTRRAEESLQAGATGARWSDAEEMQAFQKARASTQEVAVENTQLAAPFALHDRHRNILTLSTSLVRHFEGTDAALASVTLLPRVLFSFRESDNPHELTLQEVEAWMLNPTPT